MYTKTDRRLFRRIEGRFPVSYRPPGSRKELHTTTKNISGGGMCIHLVKRLAPGTILDLEIFRTGLNVSAKCKGEITWISNGTLKRKRRKTLFDAGIKFIDLSFLYIGNLIGDLEAKAITGSR